MMTHESHGHDPVAAEDEGYEGPDIEMPLGDDEPPSAESTVDAARSDSSEGDVKKGGLGQDGTIPDEPDGVAAGHTGERSSFEPEEDGQAQA